MQSRHSKWHNPTLNDAYVTLTYKVQTFSYYVGTANNMEVRRLKVYQNMSLPFVSGKEKWQLTLQSKTQCNLHSKNNRQGTTRSHWMLEIYRMDWTPLPQTVASMILHQLWSHFLHTVWSWKSNDTYKTFCFGITLQFRHLLLQPLLLTILWCS